MYNGYLGSIWDIYMPSITPQPLATDPSQRRARAKPQPFASRCYLSSNPACGAACRRDGPASAGSDEHGPAWPGHAQWPRACTGPSLQNQSAGKAVTAAAPPAAAATTVSVRVLFQHRTTSGKRDCHSSRHSYRLSLQFVFPSCQSKCL